nr:unnamed protein product [Callosobruchus chinensis]
MELEEKLKHHQDEIVIDFEGKLKRDQITSALKLRFEHAHLTELLHGQQYNWTQQAKEDLTKFAYNVQNLAKRVIVNSLADT